MSTIPYGRQEITDEDIQSVVNVLRSDYLTQGPLVPEFEEKVKTYCGAQYALAVNSATSALHIACMALGLGSGDELWTSPITFVASANCGLYCGAKVDFVDIDPKTYNLCPNALEEKLARAKQSGRLPKVVVAVHLAGQSCDMRAIHKLSKLYGFRVIEDASHAIGGSYLGAKIGACKYSDITIFSFHPVKIITTAEGGMALTNSDELANKMSLLRSHGITRDISKMVRSPDGPWYYEQTDLGYNYRMTELQAALGVSQMNRLDKYVAKRHELAGRYMNLFQNHPITLPWQDPEGYSGLHLYIVRLKLNEIQKTHLEVFECMRAKKIAVNLHYIPVYRHPYYCAQGIGSDIFIEADRYYAEAISLPMFPSLTIEEQDYVASSLIDSLN
jgi:UDP-4-amino-4,6-dideoxy-N-acetyl-beta-L-altrosamine transaminase